MMKSILIEESSVEGFEKLLNETLKNLGDKKIFDVKFQSESIKGGNQLMDTTWFTALVLFEE